MFVLVFEQDAKRVGDGSGVERDHVELGERRGAGPVEGSATPGRLKQILLAQRLHERHHLRGKLLLTPGTLARTIANSRSAFG